MLVVGLLVVGAGVAVASRLATPSNKPVACQPVCDHPPTVMPVSSRPLYVGANKAYSVRYDPSNSAITSTTGSGGVTETLHRLDGGVIKLFGLSASGRSAKQVARDVIQQGFPDAKSVYQLPNAIVGFQPGYGEVDDVYPQSSGGTAIHDRLIVMVAIKNNVALVGEAFGPYDPAKPGGTNNDGHATGASLLIAELFDPLVNTFSWQGDSIR